MTGIALGIVLAKAFLHSTWNSAYKKPEENSLYLVVVDSFCGNFYSHVSFLLA